MENLEQNEQQEQQQEQSQEQQQPQEMSYHNLINADGTFKDDFYTSLPDDLGSHSGLRDIKSVVDLSKSFVNTKAMTGQKMEDMLKSEDAAIIAQRNEILGIPKDKGGYDITIPELPENMVWNEGRADAFKEIASDAKLSNEQVQMLVEWDIACSTGVQEDMTALLEQQKQEGIDALKQEWGSKYEYNESKVKQATDYLGISEDMHALGLDDAPEFKKMVLEKLVPAISNDKLVESKADDLASNLDTLEELEAKMHAWEGSAQDPQYIAWGKQLQELLSKVPKRSLTS